MPKLTKAEQRLLDHPPNRGTWMCRAQRTSRESGEKTRCETPNSGKDRTCWLCQSPKPSKPKLLWPVYVAICEKAGVEPRGAAA